MVLDSKLKVFRNYKDKSMSSFPKESKIKQNSFFFSEQFKYNNLQHINDILILVKAIMDSILNVIHILPPH